MLAQNLESWRAAIGPYQDPLHKIVTSNDIVADRLQPCGSGSASGRNIGADLLAGNATDRADTAPDMQSEFTTVHDINNTQNAGGVEITHVSPSGTESRVYDDGHATQLTSPRRQIRVSPIRLVARPTSLFPRVVATSHTSPITVEVLSGSYTPPSNNIATLRSFLPGDAPTNTRRNQRHLVRMEDSSQEWGGALPS
ncbi:hypothetical protein AAF712_012506 [Marasmius tenuissimus]|uniref:Uncharacterized protein n=1 Tax=Marasmius tenuissimus TaxID=585030 RepID=A0ABR2ZGB5_9AGAR